MSKTKKQKKVEKNFKKASELEQNTIKQLWKWLGQSTELLQSKWKRQKQAWQFLVKKLNDNLNRLPNKELIEKYQNYKKLNTKKLLKAYVLIVNKISLEKLKEINLEFTRKGQFQEAIHMLAWKYRPQKNPLNNREMQKNPKIIIKESLKIKNLNNPKNKQKLADNTHQLLAQDPKILNNFLYHWTRLHSEKVALRYQLKQQIKNDRSLQEELSELKLLRSDYRKSWYHIVIPENDYVEKKNLDFTDCKKNLSSILLNWIYDGVNDKNPFALRPSDIPKKNLKLNKFLDKEVKKEIKSTKEMIFNQPESWLTETTKLTGQYYKKIYQHEKVLDKTVSQIEENFILFCLLKFAQTLEENKDRNIIDIVKEYKEAEKTKKKEITTINEQIKYDIQDALKKVTKYDKESVYKLDIANHLKILENNYNVKIHNGEYWKLQRIFEINDKRKSNVVFQFKYKLASTNILRVKSNKVYDKKQFRETLLKLREISINKLNENWYFQTVKWRKPNKTNLFVKKFTFPSKYKTNNASDNKKKKEFEKTKNQYENKKIIKEKKWITVI